MSVTGRAMFHLATAKKAFHEARSLTPFFRVFRRLPISRGSTTLHSSIRTWHLSFELAPALRKPARSAACDQGKYRQTQQVALSHQDKGERSQKPAEMVLALIRAGL